MTVLTISPQPNLPPARQPAGLSARFWAALLLTGMLAGLGGGLLMLLLRTVQHLAWSYRSGDFLDAVLRVGVWQRVLVLAAAGLVTAVVGRLLREHTAGGGGELSAAIWFRAGALAPARSIGNAVLSIVVVGLGASLGRESAPKQVGAVAASVLSDRAGLAAGQRRLLAACGAGAGMAAVYNVPLGGALFALEVLLGTMSLPLVVPALATSLIATGVSWLILPDRPVYALPVQELSTPLVAWALLAGPLAGLVSVGYIRALAWADGHKPSGVWQVLAPLLVFAALGVLSLALPGLLGNGRDVAQLAFEDRLALPLLLALVLFKPLATVACLGSGAPGGLFTPTMTLGAVLGGLLGQAWQVLWPGPESLPGSCALLGAGAVLAASMQGPLSAVVLVAELTRQVDGLMVPMLLAVSGAVFVTRRLEPRSIYSGRIHAARDVESRASTGEGAEVISAAARYPELLHLLLRFAGRVRPIVVVDEAGIRIGEVCCERVVEPDVSLAPLETATAADFVIRSRTGS